MPQRSTEFQKLILLIESQRSAGATVRESHLMTDRLTNVSREVDITLSSKIGDHEVIISIEVNEKKRRADRTWIEQQYQKHQTLPTNKLMLVSKCGFTKDARKAAASFGIEVMSLDDVQSHSFGFSEGEITNTRMNFVLPIVYLVFGDTRIFLSNKILKCKMLGREVDLYVLATNTLSRFIDFEKFFEKAPDNHRQDFRMPLPQSWHPIYFSYKKKDHAIESGALIEGYFKRFTVPLICQIGRYRTDHVVIASSESDKSDERLIVVLPGKGKNGKAIFTINGESLEMDLGQSQAEGM